MIAILLSIGYIILQYSEQQVPAFLYFLELHLALSIPLPKLLQSVTYHFSTFQAISLINWSLWLRQSSEASNTAGMNKCPDIVLEIKDAELWSCYSVIQRALKPEFQVTTDLNHTGPGPADTLGNPVSAALSNSGADNDPEYVKGQAFQEMLLHPPKPLSIEE
jgi:hypothetical protein